MIIRRMTATPAAAVDGGVVPLPDWGVIRASGADARSFLHGQLTQDLMHLSAGQARLAGYCTAKGRLLASFVVWAGGAEEFWLACSADLLPATLKRLSMFVLRAKCRLEDASAAAPLQGLAGDAARLALGDAAGGEPWSVQAVGADRVIRLPDAAGVPRWLRVGSGAVDGPALDAEVWRWLEVQSAVPRIVAATREQFVPQMVNLELVGGVDFKKGCYPGQEIVARSQYRGTLKRRALLFDVSAPAAPGQELFSASDPGQPAGMVAAAARNPAGGWSVFAETKLAAAGEALHLGSADGPRLTPIPLPYALPADD